MARPRGITVLGDGVLRREILHDRDHSEALNVPYMDMSERRDGRMCRNVLVLFNV